MIRVEVRKGNIAKAISIFNKRVKEDGDLRRVVERSEFVPKSERRRIKSRKAAKYKRKDVYEDEK